MVGLCGGILLSGYWLAARVAHDTSAAERLAVAVIAGLASLLLLVSVVNFFRPLALPWALVCLLPMALSLLPAYTRRALGADLLAFGRDPETRLAGALIGVFLAALLAGLLFDNQALHYDGTPNHDSFFWVAGAEYLKRFTYMTAPTVTPTEPLYNSLIAVVGWKSAWGRMGAEGLLALASSLVGASPLKLYLYGTAALYLPWVAAVYLTARTFFQPKLTRFALVGLALFQPIFCFYHANANLPNLLGAILGAGAIVATERALRAATSPAGPRLAWCGLIVLCVHGLLCTYHEMVAFVGLSCGLLWLRAWFTRPAAAHWRATLLVAAAGIFGFAINPASTVRGWYGFVELLDIARVTTVYTDMFAPLAPSQWLPGFLTLSPAAVWFLPTKVALLVSVLLFGGFVLAVWRAQDRFGVLAIFAGSLIMVGYTLVTGFAYGWQKTIQFVGVPYATVAPVMILDALSRLAAPGRGRRVAVWGAGAAIALFFGYITLADWRDAFASSRRKMLSTDWLELRDLSRDRLRGQPVMVEQASFRMDFFHGMWAAYFLSGSSIHYAARGENPGGYLSLIITPGRPEAPPPAAYLVGREWADTLDANSTRLLTGREYALLEQANRVLALEGAAPNSGRPDSFSDSVRLELVPHSSSRLLLTLGPPPGRDLPAGKWLLTREAAGAAGFSSEVT